MLLLVSGFKNYVKFQYVMWYATLLSFGLMLYLFFTATPEVFAQKLDAFVVASGGRAKLLRDRARRGEGSQYRSQSAVQSAGYGIGGTDRLDLAAMGELQRPAKRRDQRCALVPEPAGHHSGIADRHRRVAGDVGRGFRARHRNRLLICGWGRLLGGIGARQVQRRLSLAEHRGQRACRQPDHRRDHRPRATFSTRSRSSTTATSA